MLSYTLVEDNKLLTGLDALKFVNEPAIEDILAKRPFKSFLDFMARIDSSKVRSNAIQAFAASGCLDSFGIPRQQIFLYCSDYRKKLNSWMKKHDPETEEFSYPWPQEKAWEMFELYALEHFYLGEGFICKPVKAYKNFFDVMDKSNQYALVQDVKRCQNKDRIRIMKAIVRNFYEIKIKKEGANYGKTMLKVEIEDAKGERCMLTIFPDRVQKLEEAMKKAKIRGEFDEGFALAFSGTANLYEDEMGIILDEIYQILPPPQLPADLKAKKISLKEAKKSSQKPLDKMSKEELFEELRDDFIDDGVIDMDDENDND